MDKRKFFKSIVSFFVVIALMLQILPVSDMKSFSSLFAFAEEGGLYAAQLGPVTAVTEINLVKNGTANEWVQSSKLNYNNLDVAAKKMSMSLNLALSNNFIENTVWDFMDSECTDMDTAQIVEKLQQEYAAKPEISLTFSGEFFTFPASVIGEDNAINIGGTPDSPLATRTVVQEGINYVLTFAFNYENIANYETNIKGGCNFDVFLTGDYSKNQAISITCDKNNNISLQLNPLTKEEADKPAEEPTPIYTLTKTATNIQDGETDDFSISYDISASVVMSDGNKVTKENDLAGMYIDEILPTATLGNTETTLLNISTVTYNNQTLSSIDVTGGKRYQIPPHSENDTAILNNVTLTVNTVLSNAAFEYYIKNKFIDVNVDNTAKLFNKEGSTELASADNSIHLAKSFFSKSGTQDMTDKRIMNWSLEVNASNTHATDIFLIDRITKSAHEYEKNSITVTTNDSTNSNFSNTVDISSGGEYYNSLDETKKAAVDALLDLGEGDVFTAIQGDFSEGGSGDCKDLYTTLGLNKNQVVFFTYTYETTEYECFILPMDNLFTSTEENVSSYKSKLKIDYKTKIVAESDEAYTEGVVQGNTATLKNDAKIVYDHFCGGVGTGTHEFDFGFDINKDCVVQINSFSKTSVGYDKDTQTASWLFEVNRYGVAMNDFYLVDVVPANAMKFEGTDSITVDLHTISNGAKDTSTTLNYVQADDLTVDSADNKYEVTDFGGLNDKTSGYTYTKLGDNYVFVAKLGLLAADQYASFNVTTKVIDEAFLANTDKKVFTNNAYGWTQTAENCNYSRYAKTATVSATNALIEKEVVEKTAQNGKYTYNYSDNTAQWSTTVNPNHVPITNLLVTDTLPVGAKLQSIDSVTVYNGANDTTGTTTNINWSIVDTSPYTQDGFTFEITNNNKNGDYYANSFTFKTSEYDDADDNTYVITYTTVWDDTDGYRSNEFKTETNIDFKNTATLTGKVNTVDGSNGININESAIAYCSARFDRLVKNGETDSKTGKIKWTILANTDLRSFENDTVDYSIVDILPKSDNGINAHLVDVFSDLVISYGHMDETGKTFVETDKITADSTVVTGNFTNTADGFTIQIPAEREADCIKVEYYTEVLDLSTSFVPYNNVQYAASEGGFGQENNDSTSDQFNSSQFGQDASSDKTPSLIITKHGDNAFVSDTQKAILIKDVEFTLSPDTTKVNGQTVTGLGKVRKTNKNGVAMFSGLKNDVVYTLTEKTINDNYKQTVTQWVVGEKTLEANEFKFVISSTYSDDTNVHVVDPSNPRVELDIYNILYSTDKLDFVLQDTDNADTKLEGATFELAGTTAEGVKIKKTYTTDKDGKFTIDRLPVAKDNAPYTLNQTKTVDGYVKEVPSYEITVTKSGEIVSTEVKKIEGENSDVISLSGSTYTLENKYYYDKNGFTLFKADGLYNEVNKTEVKVGAEAKFKLTMTKQADGIATTTVLSESGYVMDKYNASATEKTTNAEGEITFDNLPYGEYTLEETGIPNNYETPTTKTYTVTVSYTGVDVSGATETDDGFTIYNTPKNTEAQIYKYYESGADGAKIKHPISDLTFSISEFEDSTINDWFGSSWSEATCKITTDKNGIANFGKLPLGVYEISEQDEDFEKINANYRYFIYVFEDTDNTVKMSLIQFDTTGNTNPTVDNIKNTAATTDTIELGEGDAKKTYYTLQNNKIASSASVTFVKTDSSTSVSGTIISDAEFKITGKTAQGREISDINNYPDVITTATSDTNGIFSFGNLPVSNTTDGYKLVETGNGDCYEQLPTDGKVVAYIIVNAASQVTVYGANSDGSRDTTPLAATVDSKYEIGNTHYTTEFSIVKTDSTNSNFKIKGANYELYYQEDGLGSEIYGFTGTDKDTVADYSVNTSDDGTATFSGVKVGTYKMKEVASTADTNAEKYLLDTTEYTVTVSKTGVIINDGTSDISQNNDKPFLLTDTPATANLSLYKYVQYNGTDKLVKNVTFTVEGDSFNGRFTNEKSFSTNENGILTITDIPVGTYTFNENDADFTANGFKVTVSYVQSTNQVTMTVTDLSDINLLNSDSSKYELKNTYITNNFSILKTDSTVADEDGNPINTPIADITFTLTQTKSAQNRDASESVQSVFTATTGENGVASFENIPVGTYTLAETAGNEGYKPIDAVTVVVGENSVTFGGSSYTDNQFKVENTPYTTSIVISKTYNYNGEKKPFTSAQGNAIFNLQANSVTPSIYPDNGIWKGEIVTSNDGKITFAGVHDGSYTLTETSVSNGYIISTETYEITVLSGDITAFSGSTSGGISATNGAYAIDNTVRTASLKVNKTDPNGNAITTPVTFTLTADGTSQKTVFGGSFTQSIATVDGVANFTNVPVGTYLLTEETAITGYQQSAVSYLVTVSCDENGMFSATAVDNAGVALSLTCSAENDVITIAFPNAYKKTSVEFVSIDDYNNYVDAEFTITSTDAFGGFSETKISPDTTNKIVKTPELTDGTYKITTSIKSDNHEENTTEYVLTVTDGVVASFTDGTTTIKNDVTNRYEVVTPIRKAALRIDIVDNLISGEDKFIKNASFTLTSKTGNITNFAATAITSTLENEKYHFNGSNNSTDKVIPVGEYTLKMNHLEGFKDQLTWTVKITTNTDSSITDSCKLTVFKNDENGNETETQHTVTKNIDMRIEIERTPCSLRILKVDADNENAPIKGITFTLTSTTNASDIKTLTTGADGKIIFENVDNGTYTLTETYYGDYLEPESPVSYDIDVANRTITSFRLGADASLIADTDGFYTIENNRVLADYTINKLDNQNTPAPIENVIFTLTGSSVYGTNDVNLTATYENNQYVFKNVPKSAAAGYTLTETVPEHYSADITTYNLKFDGSNFTLSADNFDETKDNPVTITNTAAAVEISLIKQDENGNALAGAAITISGNFDIGQFDGISKYEDYSFGTSNADGKFIDGNEKTLVLYDGIYTLKETTTPDGYYSGYEWTVKVVNGIITEFNSNKYHADDSDISIINGKATITLKNHKLDSDIELHKVNSITNTSLSGAKFVLSGKSNYFGEINKTITSDENGSVKFENIPLGEYTLYEETPPSGYFKNEDKYNVVISNNGIDVNTVLTLKSNYVKPESNGVYTVKNVPLKSDFAIYKYDISKTSDNQLAGVKFNLTQDGDTKYYAITDDDGIAAFRDIATGTYQLVEEDFNGFLPLAANYTVYVSEAENHQCKVEIKKDNTTIYPDNDIYNGAYKIGNEPDNGIITINKTSEDNEVENITFTVTGTSYLGNEVNEETLPTDSTGTTSISLPDGNYTITENLSAEQQKYYQKLDSQNVELDYNGATVDFANEIVKVDIRINKVRTDGRPISAVARFELANGDLFRQTQETVNSVATFTDVPVGTYTLTEIENPEHFVIDPTEYTVTVAYDYENNQVSVKITNGTTDLTGTILDGFDFENSEKITNFAFEKIGDNGEKVNASFTISSKAEQNALDNEVNITLGNRSSFAFELADGTYSLVENDRVIGYKPNSKTYTIIIDKGVVTSFVDNENKISTYNDERGQYEIVNEILTANLEITKSDSEGNALNGAAFTLTADSSNISNYAKTPLNATLDSTKTNVHLFNNIPIGRYTLSESVVPNGYNTANTEWQLVVEDIGGKATCSLTESTSGAALIVDEDNKVEIINGILTCSLEITKVDNEGNSLNGATFTLTADSGNISDYAKTSLNATLDSTKTNVHLFSDIPVGRYTLTESIVPTGYTAANTEWTLLVSDVNGVAACSLTTSSGTNINLIDGYKVAIVNQRNEVPTESITESTTAATTESTTAATTESTTATTTESTTTEVSTTTTTSAPIIITPVISSTTTTAITIVTTTETSIDSTTTQSETSTTPMTESTTTTSKTIVQGNNFELEIDNSTDVDPDAISIIVGKINDIEAPEFIADNIDSDSEILVIRIPDVLVDNNAVLSAFVGIQYAGLPIDIVGLDNNGQPYVVATVYVDEEGFASLSYLTGNNFYAVLPTNFASISGDNSVDPSDTDFDGNDNDDDSDNPHTGITLCIIPTVTTTTIMVFTRKKSKKNEKK